MPSGGAEHAEIQETIPGMPQTRALVPGKPPGTVVAIELFGQEKPRGPALMPVGIVMQQGSIRDPIWHLVESKPRVSTEGPSPGWAEVHRTFFYDPFRDLLKQRDIPTIGQPMEMLSIQKSVREWVEHQRLEEVILFTKFFVSEHIASRLTELRQAPYDPDEEKPVQPGSIRLFVEYCRRRGIRSLPDITSTPDGIIQADWNKGNEWVGMRFFLDAKVWIAIRKPSFKGSFETTLDQLFSHATTIRLPEWI
jgi:hypothetical protein